MKHARRPAGWVPWICGLGLLLTGAVEAQDAGSLGGARDAKKATSASASPCERDAGFHVLDFWLGDWDVLAFGEKQGTNRIEKILEGCAILEHWTDVFGNEGKSLFYYHPVTTTWKQVWITEDATRPGGPKEKTLIETFEGGGVRFQGTIPLKEGSAILDRTTLTPRDDGTVRQQIEISEDDGQTWQTTFDAVYEPRAE